MKVTDYCPRAAPFDHYLTGDGLVGVEVGVDVGAHAHALLAYCPIRMLHLIDPWPNPYSRGYCNGRLLPFLPRFSMYREGSIEGSVRFDAEGLDFIYIDQEHDGPVVTADLNTWWPKLKPGGLLGYRNYSTTKSPLTEAIDEFVADRRLSVYVETGEIVMVKT